MREIIIIFVSIALVCLGAYISQSYLNKTSDELVAEIEDLKVEIDKAKTNKENQSNNMAEEIYSKWQDIEGKWSIIVVHNELDLIETSLIAMKAHIEQSKYEDAVEELEKSIFLLEHIKEKERFELKNIL